MIEQWGKLTNDDFDVIDGKREQFPGKLQERQGIARDAAEKLSRNGKTATLTSASTTDSANNANALWGFAPRPPGHPGAPPPKIHTHCIQFHRGETMTFQRTLIAACAVGLMATTAFAMTLRNTRPLSESIRQTTR